MSDRIALRLSGVGKMYRVFPSRLHSFLEVSGMSRLMPWWRPKALEFWAVRGLNLELTAGSRLGIIGRNGAGKSTLLKLITGNLPATEGGIEVNGQIQALLETGAGFHPEFTGYENIVASLGYQGLSPADTKAAIADIEEFTELGSFLAQPFKTYSSGMQARLAFATATVVKPDLLIIDEILGSGDAYFAAKSAERMQELVSQRDASVLLVSHAMDQVVRYCDECIWLERGRLVMRGPSLHVVKAYEEFIHGLEDRRLRAKNRKHASEGYDTARIEGYGDAIVLAFELEGEVGSRLDVSEVTLLRGGRIEEQLKLGETQDAATSHMAFVSLIGGTWSAPREGEGRAWRSLSIDRRENPRPSGQVVLCSYLLPEASDYSCVIVYRASGGTRSILSISKNGRLLERQRSLPGPSGWYEWRLPLSLGDSTGCGTGGTALSTESKAGRLAVTRWPGEGSLLVEAVELVSDGVERAVLEAGAELTLRIRYRAKRGGKFTVIFAAVLFRADGVCVSQNISDPKTIELGTDEVRQAELRFPRLDLGNGRYVFSVSLHKTLDPHLLVETERYDLVDRSYEFEVVGNPPLRMAMVHVPAEWTC